MANIKQSVGIDISKGSFTACICKLSSLQDYGFGEVNKFANTKSGYNQLMRWVRKECSSDIPTVFLMEATGVYHEQLAKHLHQQNQSVHVVLPNKSKHYFASLNVKSKTDAIDAKVLSQMGAERCHKLWQPPSPQLQSLKDLTRYQVQLQEQKTALGNILEGKIHGHTVSKLIIQSNKKLIAQLDAQIKSIKDAILAELSKDPELERRIQQVATIKGVGIFTVITIIAETHGFEQFSSIKQVASYAGYDVVQNESGTSVKGKTKISKKGNRYIRNALYFPAMVASRTNPQLRVSYLRITKNKPKMVGQVALQRKLLALIYSLWKSGQEYDLDHQNKVAPTMIAEATLDNSIIELL